MRARQEEGGGAGGCVASVVCFCACCCDNVRRLHRTLSVGAAFRRRQMSGSDCGGSTLSHTKGGGGLTVPRPSIHRGFPLRAPFSPRCTPPRICSFFLHTETHTRPHPRRTSHISPPPPHAPSLTPFTSQLGVNTKLLQDLKLAATPGNPTVGEIFVQLAPFMKMYASYANNYESAARLLAEYRKKKPRFEEFCLECEADPRSRGLALGSFIIMPVQRIPRYKMLLAELVKYSEDIPDFPTLEDALQKVAEVALEINESIRRYEKQQELIALDVRCGRSGVSRVCARGCWCGCAERGRGVCA